MRDCRPIFTDDRLGAYCNQMKQCKPWALIPSGIINDRFVIYVGDRLVLSTAMALRNYHRITAV